MNGLKFPGDVAGFNVQGDEGRGIFVFSLRSVGAVIIDRGIAHRQIDQAKLFIPGRKRPHVRCAAGVGFAFRRQALEVGFAHVPRPRQFTGDRIIAADDAGWRILGLPVLHLRTGDSNTANDCRRPRNSVPAWNGFPDAYIEINDTVLSEIGAKLAGACVYRDHPRIESGLDHPFGAQRVRLSRLVLVIGNPTAGGAIGDCVIGNTRIVAPFFLAGGGVDADHDVLAGTDKQTVSYLEWRVFRRILAFSLVGGHVAGAELPDLLQVFHIVARDLVEWGVAAAFICAAIGRPVSARFEPLHRPQRGCLTRLFGFGLLCRHFTSDGPLGRFSFAFARLNRWRSLFLRRRRFHARSGHGHQRRSQQPGHRMHRPAASGPVSGR